MARPGDVLLNPHTGQTITFVSIEDDLLVMESSYKAGGAPAPAHLHPSQEERFEVLSGAVLTAVDGEQQVLAEGDRITIPAATPHTFGGHPEQDGTVRWEVRPALRTDELFELLFGLADGSRTMPEDGSNPLEEYAPEFRGWLSSAALLTLVAAAAVPASAAGATVGLSGTAYEFNKPAKRLAGATVRVAERPRLRATVRRNGAYRLAVPDRARVTPYVDAPGYHRIYLQTFTTSGKDLSRVNFQVPTDGTYDALAVLLKVPLDAKGDPRDCAIVSTFSTRKVRKLSFNGFVGYGAHGVAGATASARPALRSPFYFNAQVIPDPAQKRSSKDGGVIWTRVRAGRYVIRGHHPRTRFASFVATCKPGRIVNANPPWGLHELEPAG